MSAPPVRQLLALTLHRPWSLLMARGIKTIENRKWSPGPRLQAGEWFALHAGKTWDPECIPTAQRLGVPIEIFKSGNVHESAIVAVARFKRVVTESTDPWFWGPFGWVLDPIVELSPIACQGAQGLWVVPADVAAQVRAAFRLAREAVPRRSAGAPGGGPSGR